MIEFLQANWMNIGFLTIIAALFLLLRNRPTRANGLGEILGQGQPVVVEVYSNT